MAGMAVFDKCSVLLDLKNLSFKERKSLKLSLTENGGSLCFVVTKQCSFVVVSKVSHLSPNRLRSICKFQIPVVGLDYVHSCVQKGILLPVDDYKLDISSLDASSHILPLCSTEQSPFKDEESRAVVKPSKDKTYPPVKSGSILGKFRIYTEQDEDIPAYPDDFNVAKYSIFHKDDSGTWCVLELQSAKGQKWQQYRVVNYQKDQTVPNDMVIFPSTSEEAVEVYQALTDILLASGLCPWASIPPQDQNLGSFALQQLLLEEKLNTGVLSRDVAVFVELLWTEALGCLGNILKVPVSKLSLNDVSRAEGLLIQAQRKLNEVNSAAALSLLFEVYALLPHKYIGQGCSPKVISEKLDLCQLIRDVLNVSEMTLRSPAPSCIGKFRALRCSIETVEPGCREYCTVSSLVKDRAVQIHQVLRVSRAVELQTFKGKLGNIKSLLHSSSARNFVGILSRGLLLPCVGVEHHGIERTDAGSLGNGIYFSDSMRTCLKYTKPSVSDGSRLLLVCDVALGRCLEVHRRDPTLAQAPEGHNSVHGIRRTAMVNSEFEGDEYVVYSPDQVKLKYVVQFSIDGDQLKAFNPAIDTSAESCLPPADSVVLPDDDEGIESINNPLDDVTPGLLDSSGQQLPLLGVHVKCKLMDLLSHVIIFQRYTNQSNVPIEAKYVFPLDEYAAVCGFEAFINGKHVVGQVKKKERARKQYKRAIEKGHGAYLMDQDAPDIFTITVGNLPPGASVLIKVTFVSELIVKDGSVFFTLPSSVAPWQESEALNQTTQVTVDKVYVTDDTASTREFSLDMSIEMPYDITNLQCITHKVKMKRTDCKAVVSVLPGQVMTPEGFQLSVTLSEVHLPRMWVEEHPDKDSQACMLVFYPNFDIKPTSGSNEVVILLDTSESMHGEPLLWAQRIARYAIKTLKGDLKINIILFGTDYTQAFLTAQPLQKARQAAENFIQSISPVGGSTELWRPLQALALLPPSKGIRNLFLLSDGHVQNIGVTLQLLRDNVEHSRLFTCGISSTANRHMLRALAQAGCGAYEFFDAKHKHKWAEKVECQLRRMASPGCSSVSVKWQQFNPSAPTPVQAPKQLHALFNDCHTLVYGFVPHCTQATLLGNLSGQELNTVVSTSELQKTRGTFLHKLTARALIRDYEDGSFDSNEAEHEGKKTQLKSFIIDLSKEFSILSQFTSFVAIEERQPAQADEGFTDIPKLLAEEDMDILPYLNWISPQTVEDEEDDMEIVDDFFEFLDSAQSYGSDSSETSQYSPTSPSVASSPTFEEMPMSKSVTTRPSKLKGAEERFKMTGVEAGRVFQSRSVSIDALRTPMGRPSKSIRSLGSSLPPPPPPLPVGHPPFVAHSLPRFDQSSFAPPPSPPPRSPSFLPPPPPSVGRPSSIPLPPPRRPVGISVDGPTPWDLVLREIHVSSPLKRLPKCRPTGVLGDRILNISRNQSLQGIVPAAQLSMEAEQMDELGIDGTEFVSMGSSREVARPAQLSLASLADSGSTGMQETIPRLLRLAASKDDADSGPPLRQHLTAFSEGHPSGGISDSLPTRGIAGTKFWPCDAMPAVGFSFGGQAKSKAALEKVQQKVSFGNRALNFDSAMPRSQVVQQTSGTTFGRSPFCKSQWVSVGGIDHVTFNLDWLKIFQMQISDGYWELSTELGKCVNVDLDIFAAFLESKGILSLGAKACTDILRLLATLLVLQLMRLEKLPEGVLLRTLFCLEDTDRPARWWKVKKAVNWVRWADRQYPCICSRLEFGFAWESATRQLLGYDSPPDFSPLAGLELRKITSAAPVSVVVH